MTGGHQGDKCLASSSKECQRRHWSIIKGGTEKDDINGIQTAMREMLEETGIDLTIPELSSLTPAADSVPNSTYNLAYGKPQKEVVLYELNDVQGVIRGLYSAEQLKCRDSEMDAHRWLTQEKAYDICLWNQKHLFSIPAVGNRHRTPGTFDVEYGQEQNASKSFEKGS